MNEQTDIEIDMMVSNVATYMYTQDVGFTVEINEKQEAGYVAVMMQYDPESDQVTNVTWLNSWDGEQIQNAAIYSMEQLEEHREAIWNCLAEINNNSK